MSTIAILPMKHFENAKSRLSEAVAFGHRRALAEAMYTDVLVAARRSTGIERVIVVTSDRSAARIAGGYGASVIEDTGSSHSEAAALGIARAVALSATRVLLIPGDCPLLNPEEVDTLLALPVSGRTALIVPDRHGDGTNALLLTPPDALTPSFGEYSRQRHLELAQAQGATAEVVEVPSLGLDVDTGEDYALLQTTIATSRGGAANTRGLLNQLARSAAT
jgi:2-phospho-L-lactate/phosphoenolpyruvate guanylyltransferase